MTRPSPATSPPPPPQQARPRFVGDTRFQMEVRRRVLEDLERAGLAARDSPRMALKTAVMLLWLVGSYALLVGWATSFWQAALAALSLALAIAGVAFAVQHDANHGAYSRHHGVNRLLGLTLDLLGGSSYIWQWKHNSAHHTYTSIAGADSDIEVPLGRLSPAQPHRGFHRFQQLYLWAVYGLFVGYWQLYEDFAQLARGRIAGRSFPRPRGWRLVELLGGKLLFLGWAFAVPLLLHPWWVVLVGYAATSIVLSVMLVLVFQLAHSVEEAALVAPCQKTRQVPRPWAVHQVESTVDFARRNRLLSWFVGGLNYQIEHHLFPRICHVHYPRIAPIVEATCAEYGVRYTAHATLRGAIRSHWRWLRRLGQPPGRARASEHAAAGCWRITNDNAGRQDRPASAAQSAGVEANK